MKGELGSLERRWLQENEKIDLDQEASLIPVRVDRQGFVDLGTTQEEANNGSIYLFSNVAKYFA
jgi:hypothetical protein